MTARPCVNAPAGDEAVQIEAVRATRLSEFDGRSRPAGPSAFHRTRAEGLRVAGS